MLMEMKSAVLERVSLIKELVRRGVRITEQRKVLLEIIQGSGHHLDASTLLERAKQCDPGINRATVYRTLELLKKLRLIDELDLMHLNGEKHFYEVRAHVDHLHLACFECGRIEEFASSLFDQLKAEVARVTGFHIRVARLEIGGRCSQCCALIRTCSECGEESCCKGVNPGRHT
jgi:Fur family ferric uptake transcriptional regulator